MSTALAAKPAAHRDRQPTGAEKTGADLTAARTLVRILDRFGIDPLLGFFVPGLGDILGMALGMYLVVIAAQRKVAPVVMARMFLNLTTDMLIGAVPVAGDLGDLAYRANKKNLALIEASVERDGKASTRDWLAVFGAAALSIGVLVGVVWLAAKLLGLFF